MAQTRLTEATRSLTSITTPFPANLPFSPCNPLIKALSRSKVGAEQVRLKIGLVSNGDGHNFTFTSPQAVALAERDKFEAELTNIIARNRAAPPPGPTIAAPAPKARLAGTPAPGANGSAAATPLRPPPPLARASQSRAQSVASDSRASGTPFGDHPTNDFRLRKKVLLSTPELAQLHRELVMGGHITENEFWEGREVTIHILIVACHALTRDVPVSSIYCWRKRPRTARNAASQGSSSTHDRSRWTEVSRSLSHLSSSMISLRSSLSSRRRTATTCPRRYCASNLAACPSRT